MNVLLLCTWSCFTIYATMVAMKYRWTRPPFALSVGFGLAGIAATLPALLCNLFLSRETEFWVYSTSKFHSFMGFGIGAGLGEEFWKMAAGCIVVGIVALFGHKIRPADMVLGFVTVGLVFAGVENLVAYSNLELIVLLKRGLISVPLHAALGMIHGLAAARAQEFGTMLPLLGAYLGSAAIHTLFDTWYMFAPRLSPLFLMSTISALLTSWMIIRWVRIPEVPQS